MQRTRGLVSGACPGAQRRSLGWDGRTAGRGVLLADPVPLRPASMRPPPRQPSPVRGTPLPVRVQVAGRGRPDRCV